MRLLTWLADEQDAVAYLPDQLVSRASTWRPDRWVVARALAAGHLVLLMGVVLLELGHLVLVATAVVSGLNPLALKVAGGLVAATAVCVLIAVFRSRRPAGHYPISPKTELEVTR